MPRISKKMKKGLAFFLNERGRKSYNELCRKCQHDCKLDVNKSGKEKHNPGGTDEPSRNIVDSQETPN